MARNDEMSNGFPNGGIATWARTIAWVGIPGAISVFLVFIGATEIPRLSRAIEAEVQRSEATRDMLSEHIAQNDELLRLMRWICAGVAKSEDDRRRCFDK